jgi:hypothetical protein
MVRVNASELHDGTNRLSVNSSSRGPRDGGGQGTVQEVKLADDTETDELVVEVPIREVTEAGETGGDRSRLGGDTVGQECRSADGSPKDLSPCEVDRETSEGRELGDKRGVDRGRRGKESPGRSMHPALMHVDGEVQVRAKLTNQVISTGQGGRQASHDVDVISIGCKGDPSVALCDPKQDRVLTDSVEGGRRGVTLLDTSDTIDPMVRPIPT